MNIHPQTGKVLLTNADMTMVKKFPPFLKLLQAHMSSKKVVAAAKACEQPIDQLLSAMEATRPKKKEESNAKTEQAEQRSTVAEAEAESPF